jgi:hypothetical protein
MMFDRTTKLLLAAIAIGVWANLFAPLFKPAEAIAQSGELSSINGYVGAIANGTCANKTICIH